MNPNIYAKTSNGKHTFATKALMRMRSITKSNIKYFRRGKTRFIYENDIVSNSFVLTLNILLQSNSD